jgi:hypothetical protein
MTSRYDEKNRVIKNLCIDTLFRDDYEDSISSDYIFTLPEPMHKVLSMRISAIELPNVWPSFSAANNSNSFKIILHNFYDIDAIGTLVLVEKREFLMNIPKGNYTSVNFQNMMNSYLSNVGQGLQFIYCSVDPITTFTVFRATSITDTDTDNPDPYDTTANYYSPDFYFELDFYMDDDTIPLYQKCGWMMGFKKKHYTVTRDMIYFGRAVFNPNKQVITYNAYLESESSYGSSVYPYVFLSIDDYHLGLRKDNMFSYIANKQSIDPHILGRISISSSQNTIIIDNGYDKIFKTRDFIGPVKIEKIHIKLLDRFGRNINLIGNDFSFIIEFNVLEY